MLPKNKLDKIEKLGKLEKLEKINWKKSIGKNQLEKKYWKLDKDLKIGNRKKMQKLEGEKKLFSDKFFITKISNYGEKRQTFHFDEFLTYIENFPRFSIFMTCTIRMMFFSNSEVCLFDVHHSGGLWNSQCFIKSISPRSCMFLSFF